MRQLTEADEIAMDKAWLLHFNDEPELSYYESLLAGFIAGLDHAQAKSEALEAKNNALVSYIDGDITLNELHKIIGEW